MEIRTWAAYLGLKPSSGTNEGLTFPFVSTPMRCTQTRKRFLFLVKQARTSIETAGHKTALNRIFFSKDTDHVETRPWTRKVPSKLQHACTFTVW